MIGTVYDYYLTTYASKPLNKYDTHKKSELRQVYNNIVKLSKNSPLFKFDISESTQKYAIDLKENARAIRESAGNLFTDTASNVNKEYSSSDENILSAELLNRQTNDEVEAEHTMEDTYTFHVDRLATPQINTGFFLDSDDLSIKIGDHYFEVGVGRYAYEFQFKANDNDTNKTVMEKLSRLINKSNTGISAKVLTNGKKCALEITSTATGVGFKPEIFTISESQEHPNDGVIASFGLDVISQYPENASFTLNGEQKSSASNTFTIGNRLQINLNSINTEGENTIVSLRDNVDTFLNSVTDLAKSYNNIISLANQNYSDSGNSHDSNQLLKEFRRYSRACASELETIGITFNDKGEMEFDNSLIIQASNENNLDESLAKLKNFKNGMIAKSNDISLDPMKYINKIMISYPNPAKQNFANPYLTSIYSGMMFNGYT